MRAFLSVQYAFGKNTIAVARHKELHADQLLDALLKLDAAGFCFAQQCLGCYPLCLFVLASLLLIGCLPRGMWARNIQNAGHCTKSLRSCTD